MSAIMQVSTKGTFGHFGGGFIVLTGAWDKTMFYQDLGMSTDCMYY